MKQTIQKPLTDNEDDYNTNWIYLKSIIPFSEYRRQCTAKEINSFYLHTNENKNNFVRTFIFCLVKYSAQRFSVREPQIPTYFTRALQPYIDIYLIPRASEIFGCFYPPPERFSYFILFMLERKIKAPVWASIPLKINLKYGNGPSFCTCIYFKVFIVGVQLSGVDRTIPRPTTINKNEEETLYTNSVDFYS